MVSTRSNTAAAAHTGNPATTTVSTIIAPPTYDSVPASDASAAQAVYVTNADGPPAATGPANNAIIDGSTPHVYASREEYVNQAAAKINNKLEDINDKDEQIEYLKNALLSQHGISIDLCMKHNQKAHRLVQTIRDIRVRDLHVRVLNNRLHHMGLRTRRLITQAAALREQQDSHPYSTKINEWLSNNQIERIVLRPEGQASRSGTRITRAATSRDSRSGMMVQRLGAQVDGRRVTSRVNLEQQTIADLKAKLRNAEQYVEVLEHKYEVLQERIQPPSYEAAHTDVQASVRIYLKKSRQQTNRSALDDSSSCESAASSMTPPEEWTEVSSQTPSLSERSVITDRNIACCEGLVVGFLGSLHTTQSETRSLPSKDSPGRVLLRDACKLLVKEHSGYTGTVVGTHSKGNEIPHMEEDQEVGHPLDFVIDIMSPEIIDRDIATLVFHWTTLDKFQSFERVQYRHNAINILESRLGASLTGSAAACLDIGHQIKHANDFRKSAVCIQSGLDQLAGEFYGIRSAFQDMEQTWSHPTGQKLWTANATNTIKHAQHVAQDVAKALRDIVRQCDTWDVVVPDHLYYQLQAFEICLQRQELVLNLLGMVLYVASPCELPTYPFYKVRKSLEEMEREKLKYGCEQLADAVQMRREMQVKLLKIASIDPEYKDIDMVEIWEKISGTEEWPSPETTMGNTTPTEDWSYLLHRDDTASGPMDCSFLPIPRAHPTKLVKRQQRKDTGDPTLEELLDNFGDGNKLEASYPIGGIDPRIRGLAMLAFHWTNAGGFAGIERKDLEPL
ncbi:hypothetical protein KCU99_g8120, partial [Aureobasidium melanogenum]